MPVERFPFAWSPAYQAAALPFAITPTTAYVEVSPAELRVRFGLWRMSTALSNITDSTLSGNYFFIKTAGPPHLSAVDRGERWSSHDRRVVTFATNGTRGVCLSFAQPVKALDPLGLLKHPGATLTLADLDAFADAVGHPL